MLWNITKGVAGVEAPLEQRAPEIVKGFEKFDLKGCLASQHHEQLLTAMQCLHVLYRGMSACLGFHLKGHQVGIAKGLNLLQEYGGGLRDCI